MVLLATKSQRGLTTALKTMSDPTAKIKSRTEREK